MINLWTVSYAVIWFFSSLLLTRHCFNYYTYSCIKGCVSYGPYNSEPDKHEADCRRGESEWKHTPLPPGEAMFMALFWPVVLLFGIMLWNHLRTPLSLRTKKKQPRVLTDAELKRLDEILYDKKELHSNES